MNKDIPLLLSQIPDNAEMTKQIFAAKLLRDTDLCAKHGNMARPVAEKKAMAVVMMIIIALLANLGVFWE